MLAPIREPTPRPAVPLVVFALVLMLLAACGRTASQAPVFRATAASTLAAAINPVVPRSCPVTRPPEPAFVPPAPYPSVPPGNHFWYGSPALWTQLALDGTWGMDQIKDLWWRQGFDGRTEQKPQLTVTSRRVDAPAATVVSSDATNGYRAEDVKDFMLLSVELPSPGCWEMTGHYRNQQLSFIVWVS